MKHFLLIFSLFASSNAIEIVCQLEFSGWIGTGAVPTCQVQSVDFRLNSTHVTNVTGVVPQQIQRISFMCTQSNRNITIIPPNLNDFFPNLIGIDYWSCALDPLIGNELETYPNLEWFSINSSPLTFTRVPGNLFSKNKKLRLVYIAFNALQHVGNGLLDNLPDLHSAWFQQNLCINQRAEGLEEILALIEGLRENCPDNEGETTTTSSTTTTNQPPKCEIDNFEDFVCGLEEEIEVLRDDNKQLRSEVQEIREILYELEKIVLELTSRPCAC